MGGLFNYFQQSQHPVFYIPERGEIGQEPRVLQQQQQPTKKIWE
jgi:hypothetical protein